MMRAYRPGWRFLRKTWVSSGLMSQIWGFLSLILSQQLSNLAQLAWTNYPPTVTLLLVLGSTIYYSVDTHRIYLVWFA